MAKKKVQASKTRERRTFTDEFKRDAVQMLLDGNVISRENSMYVFVQDFLFRTPSAAAAFVLGASANGWVEWKNKNNETLSDIYRDAESEGESES